MKLTELLALLPGTSVRLAENLDESSVDSQITTGLEIDSRMVVSGSVFVAISGIEADGRDYIQQASDLGSTCVIYELNYLSEQQEVIIERLAETITFIGVENLSEFVPELADKYFGSPSDELQIYGVTGTNGKTSTAYILTQVFNELGFQTAFMGTIGIGMPGNLVNTTHTTLDAVSIQRTFAELVSAGYTHVCMEVSSHALDQGRVNAVNFYAVLFTNLSQDHLDYHKTIESYAQVKRRLFVDFEPTLAVINADDELGSVLLDQTNAEFIVSYGDKGDVKGEDAVSRKAGLSFDVITESLDFTIDSRLIGELNKPNLLLVVATLLALGIEEEQIKQVLSSAVAAPGRMELYQSEKGANAPVIVDFAHTPDALKLALESTKKHCTGKLWLVFGCGGDRDQSKRSLMGAVADSLADRVVLTNDNPRNENPLVIIDEIVSGMGSRVATIIEDRATAVAYAIDHAASDDLILVAGKGHEDYQIIGGEKNAYSDRDWVKKCLEIAA